MAYNSEEARRLYEDMTRVVEAPRCLLASCERYAEYPTEFCDLHQPKVEPPEAWAPEKHLRVPEDMNPPRIEPLGPVPREDKARFQTLQVAGERLACMTVRRRSDNQQVTLVVRWSEGYLEPLAEIISGNAYELYDPEVADLIPDKD